MKRPNRSTKRLHPEAGVTLIEMMVVIVIIGLIAAVVAINVLPAQDTARAQKALADVRTLEQALQLYRLDAGRFPTTEEGLDALVRPPATGPTGGPARTEPYIVRLPSDPWNRPYAYVSPGQNGRAYDLYSLGADGVEGGEGANADIGAAK
jgi:general secretion pathway protein G